MRRIVLWALVLGLSTLSCDSGGTKNPLDPPFQGTVDGLVMAQQTSLSGVAVQLTGPRNMTTQTSSTGAFSFAGLPAGEYRVGIAGFPEDVEFSITEKTVVLAEGKATARVDFQGSKKRDASVGGMVTVEGSGLAGMTISLSGPEIRSVGTDTQGNYSFDQLRRGTYSVALTGFDPAPHSFPITVQTANVKNGEHGTADFSGTLVPQPPSPPADLGAVANGSSTIVLSWTEESEDETRFDIERKSEVRDSWGQIAAPGPNTTIFEDVGLSPATAYSYRVRACNAAGCSAFSTEAGATTEDIPPAPPSGLSAVAERDGILRVFAVASEANSLQPSVEVQFFHGGSPVHRETLLAPTSSVPTEVDESALAGSWNVAVPASLIQPGLTILAEVDPSGQIAEADEADNFFPASGSPLPWM